jgi:hypothetical protein
MANDLYYFDSRAQMQITHHSQTAIITQGSTTYMKIEEGFASLESRLERGISIQLGRRLAVSDCHSSPHDDLLHQKPSCRCIHVVRKRRTASKRFSISRNMFGFKVSASFEVDMGSSYALKLTPSLDFRAVVPYDAPAFKLVDKIRRVDINFQPEFMPDLVNATIVELQQLYSEGKARPSDMNPSGLIILHVRF